MNSNSNKLLWQCGIFTGIICFMFLFLSLFVVLSRKNWEQGLKKAIFDVLPVDKSSVGNLVMLDEKSDAAACYEFFRDERAMQKKVSEDFVLVMRITTYYGPLPAVFVYENNSVRFAGIAYLSSSVGKEFSETRFDRQLAFWTFRAEKLFNKAKEMQGAI